MTEAEQALADSRKAQERVEEIRQELTGHLADLRQVTDEFVREMTAPGPLTN